MKTAQNIVVLLTLAGGGLSQTPAGAIAGAVYDSSEAAVPGATIRLTNQSTNAARSGQTSESGAFTFPALPAGDYELVVESPGFPRTVRRVLVEAGVTTTADIRLRLGEVTESVTVDDASPQIRFDSHTVGGVVTRGQIENMPLNGRNFLELAKLEPGVQPPTRASTRTFVPVLGAPGGGNSGRGTRVTIDGGSVMAVGNAGSSMGLSQEAVQEFQISTVNMDLSTGLTFSGAANVITRSGSNELHGSAFYFFRDHKLSAYPVLNRDPGNPDPFFQRRQLGAALGGPLLRNRIFYFANLERNEQRGVVSTTLAGDFASLSRITPSPVFGTQASVRLDANLTPAHIAFARYSHDGGSTLTTAINNQNAYPSSWDRTKIWNDQSVVGLTSVLRPVLVNDLRLSYFFTSTSQSAPGQEDCPGCLGIGAPAISIPTGPTMGYSGKFQTMGRRIELNDSMSWQKGSHRVRIGTDWEYNRSGSLNYGNNPVTMVLFSPDQVRTYNARPQTPPGQQIPLPATFNTLADILKLPLQSITVGIGDPRLPQSDGGLARHWNNVRLYVQDSWKVRQSLTLNYGLAWNIDRFQNYDLAKPALLAPILGADGLGPTQKQWRNFSPALGLAWSPGIDDKTVIRAGAGIYYDFNFQVDLDSERALFSKPGLGHTDLSGTAIPNPLPGITGVPVGRALDFRGTPTFFTGSNLIAAIPAIRAAQEEKLRYTGDPSVRLIQITKQAATAIYPANLPTGTSQHSNIGFQREVVRNFVVSTDFVYRHFIHLGLANPDLNHYNSVRGPVIPKCSALQADDPTALCSNGRIKVSANSGVSAYKGLLFRADKRFSHGFQVLGSYAYSSNTGTSSGNGFNLDNWLQNRGPIAFDVTHIANLSAVSQLPWRLQLGLNLSYSSAPPGSAFIGGIDLNGDGTTGDLLPGTTVNSLNRGLERGELARLVDEFNQNYGGKNDAQGTAIKRLALPGRYAFGDNSHSLDLRLTRSFVLREHWRLAVIGEVFNLYNKANLSGFSGDLTSPAFGQPTSRATQIYGSAGPRAFQVAARMTF